METRSLAQASLEFLLSLLLPLSYLWLRVKSLFQAQLGKSDSAPWGKQVTDLTLLLSWCFIPSLPQELSIKHFDTHLTLDNIVLKPLSLIGDPEHNHGESEVEGHL